MDSEDDEFFSKPNRQGMKYLDDEDNQQPDDDPIPQASSIDKVAAVAREKMADFDEENLGEDFESTPWVPPSLEKALEHRINSVFRMGKASMFSVSVANAPDLSTGANLYFQFVYSMTIYFFFATIFALPSILFSFFGSGIPIEKRDVTNLYRFTIGNIGYDHTSLTYPTQSACKSDYFVLMNTTCVYVHGMEFSIEQVAAFVGAGEFLQVFFFLMVILHLRRKTNSLSDEKEKDQTSVTDFTVMVKGLPHDAKESDIIDHFSNLYALDKKDWRLRPKISWAEPTKHADNALTPLVKDTWVADLVVHRQVGSLISAFMSEQRLMEKLLRSRALMKMYHDNTCHARGPNLKKYLQAERQMMDCAASIDLMTEREIKKSQLTVRKTRSNVKVYPKDVEAAAESGMSSKDLGGDGDAEITANLVAAFVTFEHCESFARCMEDYHRYSSLIYYCCYPKQLLFQGKKLKISKAPEPDEVVWENLEYSRVSKFFRKSLTFFFTLILVCICFFSVLKSSVLKEQYAKEIPDISLCSQVIPALFNSTANLASIDLVRPDTKLRAALDSNCSAFVPGSVYASYVYLPTGNPVANYDFQSCVDHTDSSNNFIPGMCPRQGEQTFCPCISAQDLGQCSDCLPGQSPPACKLFNSATLASCMCLSGLKDMILTEGVLNTAKNIATLPAGDVCAVFYTNYSKATGLTYMSIFATLAINTFLGLALTYFNNFEKHSSADKNQGSMMYKLFLSTFINMAFLVLIASGRVHSSSVVLTTVSILQGTFIDFTPEWYAAVGTYFITMYVLQSLTPIATYFVEIFITYPVSRCFAYPSISAQKSTSIVMQKELNRLEVAPPFDYLSHQTQLMTLLFFAMTYATGLPVVMPLSFFTFFFFFNLDKYALLKHNERPANTEDGVMRMVLQMLPYAALLRLGFGCWMLGHDGLFTNNVIPAAASGSGVQVDSSSYKHYIQTYSSDPHIPSSTAFLLDRITKPHVFPLFILLILLVLGLIIENLWDKLPIFWLLKVLGYFKRLICPSEMKIEDLTEHGAVHPYRIMQMNHHLRQEVSPFTSDYYQFILNEDDMPSTLSKICCSRPASRHLTPEQEEEGWSIQQRERYVLRVKKWIRTVFTGGITRVKGDVKRTYEIINEHGCSSYSLIRIPAYSLAAKGIKQGLESNIAGQEMEEDEHGHSKKLSLAERYRLKKERRDEESRLSKKSNIWGQSEKQQQTKGKGKEKEEEEEEDEEDGNEEDDGDEGEEDAGGEDDDEDGEGGLV